MLVIDWHPAPYQSRQALMHRFIDPISFALERLWQHRTLVFWTLVGLTAATTLALSLTLYVDAVNTNLLSASLDDPPYAFRYRYLGSWEGRITPDDVTAADAVIEQAFVDGIGLPVATSAQYISGGSYNVSLSDETGVQRLGAFTLGTIAGTEAMMQITSGTWPPEAADGAIPVLAPEVMLYNMGVQVGDTLAVAVGGNTHTLIIAAQWTPIDKTDPAWILTPTFFDQVFLFESDDLWTVLDGIAEPVEEVDWQIIFDGSDLRTSDVGGMLTGITNGFRTVSEALPGIRLDISPEEGLQAFNADVSQLTQQLVIVILPVAGLILYFVTMLAGMLVSSQQQEDVTLSSRGMNRRALLSIHALMWLMLAGMALTIGMIASPPLVQLIGRTTSFMRFDDTSTVLEVIFTGQAIAVGAITGLLAASTGLYMAWRTTGQSIMGYKRAQARSGKTWWQRIYLDIVLLGISAYILYSLGASGGLTTSAQDPFSDPLVFLAPTLFSLGFTLFFLRVYPWLLKVDARLLSYTKNIALLMALREITRSISRYRSTLLMMCFTLSLIGYTASMASTLDRSLEDVIAYQVGADSVMIVATDAQTEESTASDGSSTVEVVGYNTLPAADLLDIEGVNAVSRVGRYTAQIVLPSQRVEGTVIGIDRGSLSAIAYFRDDFGEPLADALNRLAGNRTGILINSRTAADYNLVVGQTITMQVSILGTWYDTSVPIVGMLDYFPTLDPREGFFAITNLDPIFELVGTELPYNAWMSLTPDADPDQIRAGAETLGYPVLEWQDPDALLAAALADPTRRGVLGFLSIGFVAAILLALVGSVIQNTASFKAQAVQIGSLRAMGLASSSVSTYLIATQGIAALGSIAGGTLIGVGTTLLFLPLMDFSGGLPPYLIQVAWLDIAGVYGLFAAALVAVMLSTTILLGREQVSTLVKLGDV
jgi:putative ABC transport system permease protein